MIEITRIGGNPLGISQYQLTMHGKVLVTSFDHCRPDDLPVLLRKAADAISVARAEYGTDMYSNTATAV